MGMYVKGYVQRVTMIIIAVGAILVSSLLCYGLFHEKLNRVSGQINSYDSADYSTIYILNYGKAFKNECLYPDVDIQFYSDAEKTYRLAVSSIMREEGVSYDLEYLTPLSKLDLGEVCITENVADAYNLRIGDVIFAEYPYSLVPEALSVSNIIQTDYDYGRPTIDNDIGVVFIGFNEEYATSTNGKHILYSENSKAEELAAYPQIINEVINKSENIKNVASQGTAALIFGAVFSLAAVILAQMVFFSKSRVPLYRCYIKGMKRFCMSVIPLLERLVLCLLPCVLCQLVITSGMPKSFITSLYRWIPIGICGLFCVVMFAYETLKLRRKGG